MTWTKRIVIVVFILLGIYTGKAIVHYYNHKLVEVVVEKKVEPKLSEDCWGKK